MKVILTHKVHAYSVGTRRYLPGDVFEVDESQFVSSFMARVPVPVVQPVVVEEPVIEVIADVMEHKIPKDKFAVDKKYQIDLDNLVAEKPVVKPNRKRTRKKKLDVEA